MRDELPISREGRMEFVLPQAVRRPSSARTPTTYSAPVLAGNVRGEQLQISRRSAASTADNRLHPNELGAQGSVHRFAENDTHVLHQTPSSRFLEPV